MSTPIQQVTEILRSHHLDATSQDSGNHCTCGSDSRFEQRGGDLPWKSMSQHRAQVLGAAGLLADTFGEPVSGWLADQCRAAKVEGLRQAADDIVTDWAPVWGGPGMWFTTGDAVAELVADTLRSMASELES